MSRVFVAGLGAVSPAGWNVAALRETLAHGEPLPTQPLAWPGAEYKPLRARLVPPPPTRPAFLAHPRLRRTSAITHYAAAAGLEAAAATRAARGNRERFGVIVCLQAGCVEYSCRFFAEAIKDPTTASPLLFPETVYAAPASHVAAFFENVSLAYTVVGDPGAFLQGVALGAEWIAEGRADACLVIGAEEINWILADALGHLQRPAVIAGGAGALCLTPRPELSCGVELATITTPQTYTARFNRKSAARAMRAQLGAGSRAELLCDGLGDTPPADAPEREAWSDWPGLRISPKAILGEGLMAAAGWQCVAACDAVAEGRAPAATVSLVGSNQHAVGGRFQR